MTRCSFNLLLKSTPVKKVVAFAYLQRARVHATCALRNSRTPRKTYMHGSERTLCSPLSPPSAARTKGKVMKDIMVYQFRMPEVLKYETNIPAQTGRVRCSYHSRGIVSMVLLDLHSRGYQRSQAQPTSERTGFISAHAHMLAMSTRMFCLTDLEAHAEKTLSELASNFFKTGSNDETSLRWNTEAFQRYALYQATVQSWFLVYTCF